MLPGSVPSRTRRPRWRDRLFFGAFGIALALCPRADLAQSSFQLGPGLPFPVLNGATFGVRCDGRTDNTLTLQAFFNALGSAQGALFAGLSGMLPQGVCLFSGTLTLPGFYYQLSGAGPYSTVLLYDGPATNIDLLHGAGNSNVATNGRARLTGFRIASATKMTGGAALHVQNASRVQLDQIVFDGSDGNRNLWNGLYLDQIDNIRLDGWWESYAQNDCVAVSGLGAGQPGVQYDVFFAQGKASGCTNGIHIGGGMDNVHIEDVEAPNNTNADLLIDTALSNMGNQEIYVGRDFSPGQAGVDAIQVNDALCSQSNFGYLVIDDQTGGAAANGIHIKAWGVSGSSACTVSINSSYIAKNGAAGLQIDTASPTIIVSPSTVFDQNGTYGISANQAVTVVNCGLFRRSAVAAKTSNITCSSN